MSNDGRRDMFASALAKVDRARHHFEALQDLLDGYFAEKPLRVAPDIGETAVHVRVCVERPIPSDLPLILGDCIHNLRSALDHVVYEAVAKTNERNCDFRVWEDGPFNASRYRTLVKRRANSPNAAPLRQRLYQLRPYLGGADEDLWCLHRLDVIDKHRLVIAVSAATEEIRTEVWGDAYVVSADRPDEPAEVVERPAKLTVTFIPEHRFPLTNGTVLFTQPASEWPYVERIDWAYNVALTEPEPYAGRPVLEVLGELLNRVEVLISTWAKELDSVGGFGA